MNTQIFQYNSNPVTFRMESGTTYVSATDMAKPFGKRPVDYLRLPSTNELVKAVVRKSHIGENQAVISERGGVFGGGTTWLHEDVALDFAQWLSVDFRLWCLDRLKELLRHGITATQPTIDKILDDPDNAIRLLTALKEERQRVQMLEGERDHLQEHNRVLAPKAQYTDEVLQSSSTYTFTQLSKELDFRSAQQFIDTLRRRGIIFKQSGQYMLTSKFAGKGFTKTRTARFFRSDGTPDCSTSTVWTEKGRAWLHNLFHNSYNDINKII